jgi:two-component system LytT family response regulator
MNRTIRVLIVDDVELARESIRIRLTKHKDMQVVAEAASARDALVAIPKLRPDLIFLDIQLPGANGFKILKDMQISPRPAVVFVTAHDEFAVRAFAANAEHYLLKPIDDEQFDEALQRVRKTLSQRNTQHEASHTAASLVGEQPPAPSHSYLHRISVKDGENYRMLKTVAIDWIESGGNYVHLRTKGQSFTARMVLKDIEEKLDPTVFARISKSVLVNLDSVVEIKKLWHGDFEILLADRARVRLSRRYRERVLSGHA